MNAAELRELLDGADKEIALLTAENEALREENQALKAALDGLGYSLEMVKPKPE